MVVGASVGAAVLILGIVAAAVWLCVARQRRLQQLRKDFSSAPRGVSEGAPTREDGTFEMVNVLGPAAASQRQQQLLGQLSVASVGAKDATAVYSQAEARVPGDSAADEVSWHSNPGPLRGSGKPGPG